jgi:hypothetical protein
MINTRPTHPMVSALTDGTCSRQSTITSTSRANTTDTTWRDGSSLTSTKTPLNQLNINWTVEPPPRQPQRD